MHKKGYHATLRHGQVEWDLTPGAYDHWLKGKQADATDRLAQATDRVAAAPDQLADAAARPDELVRRATPRTYDMWDQLETATSAQPPPPWRP